MTLGDVFDKLPPEVAERVVVTLNGEPDDIRAARQLKDLLRPHAAALEATGVIPDYLAYLLIHVRQQHQINLSDLSRN